MFLKNDPDRNCITLEKYNFCTGATSTRRPEKRGARHGSRHACQNRYPSMAARTTAAVLLTACSFLTAFFT